MTTSTLNTAGTVVVDYNDPAAWTDGIPNSTTPGIIGVATYATIDASPLNLDATELEFTGGGAVVMSIADASVFDPASQLQVNAGTYVDLENSAALLNQGSIVSADGADLSIGNTASFTNDGTITIGDGGDIDSGVLPGGLTVGATFINNGVVQVTGAGSVFNVDDPISGSGTFTVGAGGEADLLSRFTGNTIEFLDNTSTILVQVGTSGLSQIATPILGLVPGDTIAVVDSGPDGNTAVPVWSAYAKDGILSFHSYGGTLLGTLDVPGVPDGAQFNEVSDPASSFITDVVYTTQPINLVRNDSFEDDGINFTNLHTPIGGWTLSGSPQSLNAGETSSFDPALTGHSGYLAIGTVGKLGFVSQVVQTVADQQYTLSFSFSSDGTAGNAFEALWNGNTVMAVANTPYNPDWADFGTSDVYSFTETAVSSSTTIAFGGMGDGSSYVGIDDVSVTPVNLVQNSSFEDDGINLSSLHTPISGWTLSDTPQNLNAGETSSFDPALAGHGGYLAIGTVGKFGLVSQVVQTVAGQQYMFSFSFSSDGATGNAFEALWNGNTVMAVADTPYNPDWANFGSSDTYSFTETATSTATTIAFGGMGDGSSYVGVDDVSVTPITTVACFLAGTLIATPNGEMPVECLSVGDPVRTVLGEAAAPIIWVGRREVDCARQREPRAVWPVRVSAGAFGPGLPHRDLWLSPDHAVYVQEVLIPVKHLINGSTIAQVQVAHVTYHHIELPQHDVVLAQGLPVESFLDLKDGSNYPNRPGPVRLYPDFTARMWEAFGCARLVVAGPQLVAARTLLASFAAQSEAA